MSIKKENLKFLSVEQGFRINNFKDCDVIHEAIMQIKDAKTDEEALEGMKYLIVAVEFRRGDAKLLRKWKDEFVEAMNAPEPGKQYRLTGGTGVKAISNGNTWKESEMAQDYGVSTVNALKRMS